MRVQRIQLRHAVVARDAALGIDHGGVGLERHRALHSGDGGRPFGKAANGRRPPCWIGLNASDNCYSRKLAAPAISRLGAAGPFGSNAFR